MFCKSVIESNFFHLCTSGKCYTCIEFDSKHVIDQKKILKKKNVCMSNITGTALENFFLNLLENLSIKVKLHATSTKGPHFLFLAPAS